MQWNLCSMESECGFSLRTLLHRLRQNVHEVFDSWRKMFFEWNNKYKILQPPLREDQIHLLLPWWDFKQFCWCQWKGTAVETLVAVLSLLKSVAKLPLTSDPICVAHRHSTALGWPTNLCDLTHATLPIWSFWGKPSVLLKVPSLRYHFLFTVWLHRCLAQISKYSSLKICLVHMSINSVVDCITHPASETKITYLVLSVLLIVCMKQVIKCSHNSRMA